MKTFAAMIVTVLTVGYLTALAAQQIDSTASLQVGKSGTSTGQSSTLPNISRVWRNLSTNVGNSGSGTSGNVTTASQSSNETTNWSGYDTTGGTYTAVSGSWNVPNVTASNSDTAADAAWIGIGGVTSQDLIQIGTQNIVNPDGSVSTSAFYEMLPDTSNNITSITVNPGDSVSASISQLASGQWQLNIKDTSNGESYSNTVSYDSSLSSAEWVEEDPSDANSLIPLDNFGTITFTGASTVDNGSTESISGSQGQAMTMMNSAGQSLANDSSLSGSGESFSVTRTSAAADSGGGQSGNYPGGFFSHGSGFGSQFENQNNPGITTYVQFYE